MMTSKKILGVYHIGCIGRYLHIVRKQLEMLYTSGLYNRMKKLIIFISNYNENDSRLKTILELYDPKRKFVLQVSKDNLMEKFAINEFRKYIQDESYVFYFHSKGVSHSSKEMNYHNWRKILDHYTIKQWELNLKLLLKNHAVGCFLTKYPTYHFSGNFWWARTEYVMKLPPKCGDAYLSPEMWIGTNYDSDTFVSFTNDEKYNYKYHREINNKNKILQNITKEVLENKKAKNYQY